MTKTKTKSYAGDLEGEYDPNEDDSLYLKVMAEMFPPDKKKPVKKKPAKDKVKKKTAVQKKDSYELSQQPYKTINPFTGKPFSHMKEQVEKQMSKEDVAEVIEHLDKTDNRISVDEKMSETKINPFTGKEFTKIPEPKRVSKKNIDAITNLIVDSMKSGVSRKKEIDKNEGEFYNEDVAPISGRAVPISPDKEFVSGTLDFVLELLDFSESENSELATPYVAEFTYDAYFRQIWNRINELYSGKIKTGEFLDSMASTIQDQLTKAYRAALRVNNIDPEILKQDNDFSQALEEMILSEYNYVDGLAADVEAAAGNQLPVTNFQQRARLWAERYNSCFQNANQIIQEMDGGNQKWIYSEEVEEHCPECEKLNGMVARASEWRQLNLNPPQVKQPTSCQGWRCACRLENTEQRRSPNAFTEILNIITSQYIKE